MKNCMFDSEVLACSFRADGGHKASLMGCRSARHGRECSKSLAPRRFYALESVMGKPGGFEFCHHDSLRITFLAVRAHSMAGRS